MLTEQQKNYLDMLLLGDTLTENEVRLFLGRSSWNPEQINAGVEIYKTKHVGVAQSGTAFAQTNPTPASTFIENRFESNIAQPKNQVNLSPLPSPNTPLQGMVSKSAFFDDANIKKQPEQTLGYPNIPYSASNQLSQPTGQNSQARVMQTDIKSALETPAADPKPSMARKVLSFVSWLLFISLVLMIAGLIGYMYYTKTGLFA